MDNTLMAAAETELLTLLYFDGIILAFPQNQIFSIENLEEIQMQTDSLQSNSTGTLIIDESNIPVHTLDQNLNLMPQTLKNNAFCIVIKHPEKNESFAITCDSVKQNINEDNSAIYPIPALMYNPDSPLTGLLNIENSLILISSEEKMQSYINSQEQQYV